MSAEPFRAIPGESVPPASLQEYERFLVFSNPVSRHAQRLGVDLEQLHRIGAYHHLAVSSQNTSAEYHENVDEIGKYAEDGDIVVVRGGDGTAGLILDALMELKLNIPTLIIPRGNANDLAHMLYAKPYFDKPEAILKNEEVASLHPLEVRFKPADGEEERANAWTYLTIGCSALTAYYYNQPEYRNSMWHKIPGGTYLKERLTAVHGYFASPHFYVTDEDGKKHRRHERVISAGERMAKQFKLNVDLFSEETRIIDARNKLTGIATIGSLVTGRVIGGTFTDTKHFTVEGQPTVWAQLLGEEKLLEGKVEVTIGRSDRSVPVFTAFEQTGTAA